MIPSPSNQRHLSGESRGRATRLALVTPPQEARVAPAALSDAELLDRCRRHDPEAWDLLVARYERLVYSVARVHRLSAEDAADVTEATFIALLESITSGRAPHHLTSWLITVARRHSWPIANRAHKEGPRGGHEEAPGPDVPPPDWATVMALHEALNTLGGTCRYLLEALYFDAERLSHAEIAARIGCSSGGITAARGRCLQKLRALLDEGDMLW